MLLCKGFPLGGSCRQRRLMRGRFADATRLPGNRGKLAPHPALRATFSLRAKSRLRRLRSDTRLRAQSPGEGFSLPPRPPQILGVRDKIPLEQPLYQRRESISTHFPFLSPAAARQRIASFPVLGCLHTYRFRPSRPRLCGAQACARSRPTVLTFGGNEAPRRSLPPFAERSARHVPHDQQPAFA